MLPVHFSSSAAPARGRQQEEYISRYSQIAVDEMFRSGVPASITLAQGMLESANGLSVLAVKGNNHFGIKCHDWTGSRMFHDDDRKGECFRKYKSPEASFRDHSDFLRYRDRYKFLFDLETTDYKGWAYGLKKAGYATDPAYPKKLINLIETYGLTRFDETDARKINAERKQSRKEERLAKKNARKHIPASPSDLEQSKSLEGRKAAEFRFSLSRHLYSRNDVAFVYSVEGETYADLARLYNLFLKEILSFNDLDSATELTPGTVVYLEPKKKQAAAHIDKYISEGNENLWEISQRYAVKLKSLLKMNGFSEGYVPKEGDTVMLCRK